MIRSVFFMCNCGAPHEERSLCVACGKRRKRIPLPPKLRGQIVEEDSDGNTTVIYDSQDTEQLGLM